MALAFVMLTMELQVSKKAEFFVVIIFSFFAGALKADVVSTSNGDSFTGYITGFDGQSLKITNAAAGEITIDAKLINSFTTDQARMWEIQNIPKDIKIEIATVDGHVMVDGQLIALGDLRLKSKVAPNKFSGIVELSWDIERDDDRERELRLKSELHYHLNKWRHEVIGELKHSEQHDVTDEEYFEINYTPDYLINSHWLINVDASHREEGVNATSYYSYAGIGPGYRFWGEEKNKLDIMINAEKIRIRSGALQLDLNAVAVVIDYHQFLFSERLEPYIDYRITYPDWSGVDYIVNSTFGLRYSFTHYMYLSFKYDFNETRYILGKLQDREANLVLGVKF